jgi:NitT/TauT family transport system ATP-binding protein
MGFHCNQIRKTFLTRQGEIIALNNIEFSVGEQEFICIVGPSGCGKTTLLKILAGLLKPTTGQITFTQDTDDRFPRSAMVFQDEGLFPWMTVLDNVAFGLEMRKVNRPTRHAQAQKFLNRVGLGDFINNYPHELSGGMRQRVAILRAFLTNPGILLMDEPFGSLDSQTRLVMQDELLRIWKDYHKTVVYVTHDIEEAILLGDRVLVMSGRPGSIIDDIPILLPRPRRLADHDLPEVVELRWKVWKMIEGEVRRELGMQA